MKKHADLPPGELKADLFLQSEGAPAFASAQIALLRAIDDSGSISKAAKQLGISYKTAWDRVEAMNNMSRDALVMRSAGGAKGGGTALTPLGKRIVEGFAQLQQEHQRFIERIGRQLHCVSDIANFVKGEAMQTSARNQFRGRITALSPGAVNTEVVVDIGCEQSIVAIITQDSAERLALAVGVEVVALVKASSVIVSTDTGIATSARNQLVGRVSRLVEGAVNSDVSIDIGGGKTVSAIITNTSVKALALQPGLPACALFKAPSVILMRDA